MRLSEFDLFEGIHDPHRFKAVFVVGGPGAGKTYVSSQLAKASGLVSLNIDEFNELLMKKHRESDPEKHIPRSRELRDKKKELGKLGGLGFLIDGTGRYYRSIAKTKQELEEEGYETLMVFVNSDLETALERNKQRTRQVDTNFLQRTWSEVRDNLGKYQALFKPENFLVLDNSKDSDFKQQFDDIWKKVRKFLES